MNAKITFVFFFVALAHFTSQSQIWSNNLVTTKLAAGTAYDLKLELFNDTIFIAFADKGNGTKANVMKYTGSQWVSVGQPNFTPGAANNLQFSISNGVPWVAFSDGANGNKASVMRLSGGSWVHAGTPAVSKFIASHLAFRVVNNIAYLAYSDAEFNDKATVVKYDGNWTTIGTPGFTPGMSGVYSLAVSGSTPYLSFRDYNSNYRASVMRYTGSKWELVGPAGFTPVTHDGYSHSLAVYGGVPYLAARGTDAKATVYRFGGSGWAPLGKDGISVSDAFGLSLTFGPTGIPYIAFGDGSSTWKLSVMRFEDNVWVSMGDRFSPSSASYINIAVKSDGKPVVGYGGITVQQYVGTTGVTELYDASSFTIFPNPNRGRFTLDIPNAGNENVSVEIFSSNGQSVRSFSLSAQGLTDVDAGNLSPGLYLVKASGTGFSFLSKMIVH